MWQSCWRYYVQDQYKTQEIGEKVVSNDSFMLKHSPDRFKTQETCDKAAYDFLPTLKFVPDWFVTSITIKKLDDALFANDNIIFIISIFLNVIFLVVKWAFSV